MACTNRTGATLRAASLFLSVAGLMVLPLAACSKEATPAAAAGPSDPAGEPAYVYEGVRGIVEALPAGGARPTELRIHHEHIPSFKDPKTGVVFVNSDGVPGMRSMVMDMPPGAGVSLDGIAVGDPVEFTLAVWTEPRVAWRAKGLRELPAGTAIDFADKPADGAEPAAAP
jgi:hypothetical protein